MSHKKVWQGLCVPALAVAVSSLVAGWAAMTPGAGANSATRSDQAPTQTATTQSQPIPGSEKPPERNKAILELEKLIAGRENDPAEKVFKNIEIFKAQPASRVLRVMELGFGPSLGMNCNQCHVPSQWDKDDKKEKGIARKMWTMTMNLNKDVKAITDEKAAVNCYTCHRGQKKPALNPPAAKEPS